MHLYCSQTCCLHNDRFLINRETHRRLPSSPILLSAPSLSVSSFAASSALSKLPSKTRTFSFNHVTNSSPEKQSVYSPRIGKRTLRRGNSAAARVRNRDTTCRGSEKPARRSGASIGELAPGIEMLGLRGCSSGSDGESVSGDITIGDIDNSLPFPLSLEGDLGA